MLSRMMTKEPQSGWKKLLCYAYFLHFPISPLSFICPGAQVGHTIFPFRALRYFLRNWWNFGIRAEGGSMAGQPAR